MTDSTIYLAATVDDAHALPLLVTVRSACRRLSAGRRLHLFVLGYEITRATRDRFESGLRGLPVEVEWLSVDLEGVRPFWPAAAKGGQITLYYRLYLGDVLPATVDRVLFLDADILVRGDLAELWSSPFEGATVQAVPDAYAARLHLPRLRQLDWSDAPAPVAVSRYFNAGALLIDLRQWRDRRVGWKAAGFLWRFGAQLIGRDQDALNLALAEDWKRLPPSWNFHELPSELAIWEADEWTPEQLDEAIRDPRIVHFIGCNPWAPDCCHMHRKQWRREAAEAGVEVDDSWEEAPRHDLEWLIRRRLFQARDLSALGRIAGLILSHPWLLLSYPAWRMRR